MPSHNRASIESSQHPYMRLQFWLDENNHFWNRDLHHSRSRAYHEKRIQDMVTNNRKAPVR